jgi:predicted phosphodiesterase
MIIEPAMCLCDPANRSLIVCIADCHYGSEWNITGLRNEIINAYSPDIFESRMESLLEQLLGIMSKEDVWNVTLLLCGDNLDGMLRNSQLMKLRYGVVESCMRFSEYMANWIAALGQQAKVSVYSVDGNHTEIRPLGSKHGEFENENMEKIIAWYLAERFKECAGIYVDSLVKPLKHLEVQGFSFLLSHDTNKKSMENAMKQAMLQYGERIDFMICGHKHTDQESVSGYNETASTMIIRVPSICGADRFAQKLGYGGKAGALVMVIERGYGRRCVYPINLE